MKAFEHLISAIYELGFSDETIIFFEKNREFILEAWCHSAATGDITDHIGLNLREFREQIAEPVYNYFVTIILQKNRVGSCPAMHSLVERFYNIGLQVEEVFINCTTFKNMIMRAYDERHTSDIWEEKHKLVMIMYYNLYGILSIYSEIIRTLNKDLKLRNSIIQENVLYTRTDCNGIILETTNAFCLLCGYAKEELIGNTHAMLKHPDIDKNIYQEMWQTIKSGNEWYGEIPNLHKDGSTFITIMKIIPIKDENGEILEFSALRTDITADRLAQRDPLTGLYNRRGFDKKLLALFTDASIKNESLCVIMGDIDHFKHINDLHGHTKGDDILKVVAKILIDNTRSDDICVRWGGEEFIVILPSTQLVKAIEIAQRIRVAIEECIWIDDIKVTCSFGIAQKSSSETIQTLFARADEKLYVAKNSGRNQIVSE